MNRYMRAIGYSKIRTRRELESTILDSIVKGSYRDSVTNNEGIQYADIIKNCGNNMGICICGEYEDDQFIYDYCYPFYEGRIISSTEDLSIERHTQRESYAGVCDDVKVGVTLIFYLNNRIEYLSRQDKDYIPNKGTPIRLSGLSIQGKIMLPIIKNELQKSLSKRNSLSRNELIDAARRGDEDAIESLTIADMDMYSNITRRSREEDIFSFVDTYFMPYGVECDQYSILGEILECNKVINPYSNDIIYQLRLEANGLYIDICINDQDLMGIPSIGRRFKGSIWLQGTVDFD